MTPTITVETITPATAQHWLETSNTNNRKLRMHRVRLYADEMRRGQWKMAGDPIRFDNNGILLDGQHRLRAVVEVGTAMEFVVVRGLDSSTFIVMDKGMNRSVGDALGTNVSQSTHKSAALRLALVMQIDGDPRKTDHRNIISRTDIAEAYHMNAQRIDALTLEGSSLYNAAGGNRSAWIAMLLLLEGCNTESRRAFIEGIKSGSSLNAGDARLALRNWLSQKGNQRVQNSGDHLALYIKAWNAFISNQSRTLLRLPSPEDAFPKMVVK